MKSQTHAVIWLLLAALPLAAEGGTAAWLRYAPLRTPAVLGAYAQLPGTVVALGSSPALASAQAELKRGVRGMLGRTIASASTLPDASTYVLGTLPDLQCDLGPLSPPARLEPDGYWLTTRVRRGHRLMIVTALNDRGVLYGVFALLRRMALARSFANLDSVRNPAAPIRWVNQWDNLDGTIERGYGGRSIFFAAGHVRADLGRVRDYARLLASLGIDGCTVNNVNADPRILSDAFMPELERLAAAMRPWGVRLSIAVPFNSPVSVGGLPTFDPENPVVAAWWRNKVAALYRAIPDLAGFLVKADSEGQLGPSTYGRTHAQAADVIARALAPHGGILVYRAFVYNHHLDYNDLKADRARAAYDQFHPLDGRFDANVVVQIKYGPIDFQVREPVSPLIAGLRHTNQALELEITQEYTGQQRDLCFLVPLWKQVLDFDMQLGPGPASAAHPAAASPGGATPVREIVIGHVFHRALGGMVGVANVGLDANWVGADLAQANLYGFGRLAWNPRLAARQIVDEWTRQTFGNDARVVQTIAQLQLASWKVYEQYTGGPLGLQTLTNILGPHFGPGPQSADHNGWGQWIRAGRNGIGMDRTVATGTGFIGQYPAAVARMYTSLATCPDNLLLFMHHAPYTYVLHSGKTVVQTVYDAHYDGAAMAQEFPRWWRSLAGRVDAPRYQAVLRRLDEQAGHAIVWRDFINDWMLHTSGIPDARGRVGRHPDRVEAEAMRLQGYRVVSLAPAEAASGGKAVTCPRARCRASFVFQGPPGRYDLAVQYFDQNNGVARFQVSVNGREVAQWAADEHRPSQALDADTSVRHTLRHLPLEPGDVIEIEGRPDGGDPAALDYVTVRRVDSGR